MDEKRKLNEMDETLLDRVTGGNDGLAEPFQDTPITIEKDSYKNTEPIWIKETSGDTGAYYGLENPTKTLEDGSKLWIKWQDKNKQ